MPRQSRRRFHPLVLILTLLALVVLPACEEGAEMPIPGFEDEAEGNGGLAEAQIPDETEDDNGVVDEADDTDTPAGGVEDVPGIVEEVSPSIVAIVVLRGGQPAGQGSGVIWSEDGLIITNNHVVAPGDTYEVVLANGRTLDAELVGGDPSTDIAVLEVDAENLPAAEFAEELPDVGELAVAVGNPFGFAGTATAGIISGLDRDLPVQQTGTTALVGLIQTDAPISPGNSGGGLIDAEGTVVGINTAAIPPQAGATALGFAIPAPLAIDVAESLVETGEFVQPFLGIRGFTVTRALANRLGLDTTAGVVIADVAPGSPAAEAGLERGDIITALDDTEVADLGDLLTTLRRREPAEEVTVTVIRGGEETEVEVTLDEAPSG